MPETIAELRSHVSDLEYRLHEYHQWLEQAVADRDRLALDAAWGVHAALCAVIASGIVWASALFGLGAGYWWSWLVAVIGAQTAGAVAHSWSNRHRLEEVERLSTLPEWTWKDPDWR